MPTYEYKCVVCGHKQELRLPITNDTKEIACEVCGCLARRQIGTGAYIDFKGDGFYCTDYGNKKKGKK